MTNDATRWANRYWGEREMPKAKAEFFNAVTTPAPTGAAEGTVATIRMYGPIDSWGGYWGISTKDVGQVLDALPESVSQIILRINSPGGEVFEGMAILNMLRAHRATVTAVVDGLAGSAASFIAAGCDETVMSPGTTMMIHSPSVFTWGNAADLRKDADVLDTLERAIIEVYTGKAGDQDWASLLAEDTWLTSAEAVELGLADRVAVIPDAGESETVGDDGVLVVAPIETDDDDADDALARARVTPIRDKAAAVAALARTTPDSTEPGDPNPKEELIMSDTLKAGLRERLGVTDAAASDETLLAALDEALAEQPTTETPEPRAAVVDSLPDTAIVVDKSAYEELQRSAAAGREALAQATAQRRDGLIAEALADGRITAATKDTWRAQLDTNEDVASAILAGMPKNAAVPTEELGHAIAPTDAADDPTAYPAHWAR
ncbi:peptidase [Agrococcus pavilionensis RW1]|uniref:ATP-dependent Clp protease proteolytic subunit n=1 Tax=Agrococcus pavilionensis RW1 TaxID=1330458 RepID=U1L924_9MICO|nr:head maturation protease, ClpP-related [Agrococcus pavilionensis]ERG63473.1 peptidase [Agrococcus pavilionensis RW1]